MLQNSRCALVAASARSHALTSTANHGSPIDYRRRRATFTDIELTNQEWRELCARADAHPGRAARLLHARRHLFQLLTGADLSHPAHLVAFRTPADKGTYLGFQRFLTTPLRQELHQHAAQMLTAAGIDEPVTWTPPADCVAGLTLPGRDPDDIDLAALHKLVIVDNQSLTAAARRLGVTVEHVRHALPRLHRPPTPHPKNSPPAARRLRQRATSILTVDFFHREHLTAGKNMATIAAETGIHRKLLTRYAQRLGVLITPTRRRACIDPGWLHEQAHTFKRTNVDIAAELGLTHETIHKHLIRAGISRRRSGTYSDRRYPHLPDDIRRVVEGQRHGWQRLRRFQQMTAYPSINLAAAALSLHTQNLQIQRLEADIGAQLLHRAPHRYTPMTLTDRGQRLIDDLNRPDVTELDRQAGARATTAR